MTFASAPQQLTEPGHSAEQNPPSAHHSAALASPAVSAGASASAYAAVSSMAPPAKD